MCVHLESFSCKISRSRRKRRSWDCSLRRTRRDQPRHNHTLQTMLLALLLSTTRTVYLVGVISLPRADSYRNYCRCCQAGPNGAIGSHEPEQLACEMHECGWTYISVFLLSSPVVFLRILVMTIITTLSAAILGCLEVNIPPAIMSPSTTTITYPTAWDSGGCTDAPAARA